MTRLAGILPLLLLSGCEGVPTAPVSRDAGEYGRIVAAQRHDAAVAGAQLVSRGREVFLHGPCAMCHTIRGTLAASRVGPDLTHLASRRTLAAGTLANTRGHLTGWILNPQNLKPGSRMPPTLLTSDDLHALVAFLETLK
jgi:cytochrome c oxidase subunit II